MLQPFFIHILEHDVYVVRSPSSWIQCFTDAVHSVQALSLQGLILDRAAISSLTFFMMGSGLLPPSWILHAVDAVCWQLGEGISCNADCLACDANGLALQQLKAKWNYVMTGQAGTPDVRFLHVN
mgnify:CR=1 FL=1